MGLIKDILKEITRLRMARGWTEYELSVNSGIPQSTISTWYRKEQQPTIRSLDKICKGFDITLSQFFAEDDEKIKLSDEQKRLFNSWAALSPEQKAIIINLLESIKKPL